MDSVRSDRAAIRAPAPEDPRRRRLRGGQDHAGRRGQRDPAAADRGGAHRRRASAPTTSSGVESKRTTTVAMDFGRITISRRPACSTCSARRDRTGSGSSGTSWRTGALGAVVLADTRRLADCFPSIDYFERRGTPFLVAVNCFDGEQRFSARGGAQRARPRPGRAGGALRRPRPAVRQGRADRAGRARAWRGVARQHASAN